MRSPDHSRLPLLLQMTTSYRDVIRCLFLWRWLHFYIIIFGNYKHPDYICPHKPNTKTS